MRRFFDRPDTRWRTPHGCLHVYVVPGPGSGVRDEFARMATSLADVPGLSRQPAEFLHVTVQQFDAFTPDLADRRWRRLAERLPDVLGAHAPFELKFAAPAARSHSVEAVAHATDEWVTLVSDLRRSVVACGLGDALTPAPYAPHVTLAYCTARTPDETADAALAPAATATTFRVDRLSLVAVDQDEEAGVFRFETISEWRLGGRRPEGEGERP